MSRKCENLINKKFGKWTVLEKAEKNNSGNIMWKCVCECGNIKSVRGSHLKHGHSTKCIECKKDNLTNKKFGKWTVINKSNCKNSKIMWNCICECGTKSEVSGQNLKYGKSKQCLECKYKIKDLSNQIFGFWTVIKKGKKNKYNEITWVCQCKCGTIKNISSSNLKNNSSTKCKKCKNEEQKQHKFISGKFFGQIKQGAKTRNIEFNLSKNQIGELFNKQNKKCSLTGLKLILNHDKEEENTASLDRINSLKCYEINNVQWVHKTINKMKQDLPQEEFIYFCKLISEKN